MDLDELTLGARIREARDRAGLSQDLAARVGLDRTALVRGESGSRRLTALELAAIADELGVRMASFFRAAPGVVAHRASQGSQTQDSVIDKQIARLADDAGLVLRATGDMVPEPDRALPVPRSREEAESLAVHVRKMVGLDRTSPVGEVSAVCARLGLWVFGLELGPDTADAACVLLERGGVALVNSTAKVGRRRLAAIHELGHYLVRDDYRVDWRVDQDEDGESRFDQFARELLLPEDGLRKEWSTHSQRGLREAAVVVASRFRVDMSTLARRALDLELISHADAREVRSVRTTQTDIVELGLYVADDLAGTSLPAAYVKTVLRAYRDCQVSAERTLELLHDTFTDDDLPPLPPRRADELWGFVS